MPMMANMYDMKYEKVDGRLEDPLDELERELAPVQPDTWIRNLVPLKHAFDDSASSINIRHNDSIVTRKNSGSANPFGIKNNPSGRLQTKKPEMTMVDRNVRIEKPNTSSVLAKSGIVNPQDGENFSFIRVNNRFTKAEIAAMTKWEPIEVETVPLQTTIKMATPVDDFEKKFREDQEAKDRAILLKSKLEKHKINKKGKKIRSVGTTYDYNGSLLDIEHIDPTVLPSLEVQPHCVLVPVGNIEVQQEVPKNRGFFFKKPVTGKDEYAKFVRKMFIQYATQTKREDSDLNLGLATNAEDLVRAFQPEMGVRLLLNNRFIKSETLGADGVDSAVPKLNKEYLQHRIDQAKARNRGSSANSQSNSHQAELEEKDFGKHEFGKKRTQFLSMLGELDADNIPEFIHDLDKFRDLIKPDTNLQFKNKLITPKEQSRVRKRSVVEKRAVSVNQKMVRFEEPAEREYYTRDNLPNIIKIKTTERVEEKDLEIQQLEARTRLYLKPVGFQDISTVKQTIPPLNKTYRVLRTHGRAKSEGLKVRERRSRL